MKEKSQETNRVKAEGNRNKGSWVVECRLNGVHVRPRERCQVVRLVVQSVNLDIKKILGSWSIILLMLQHLSVKELSKVRNRGGLPWVHGAMHGMEVGNPWKGEIQDKSTWETPFLILSATPFLTCSEWPAGQTSGSSLEPRRVAENTLYTLFWHDYPDVPDTDQSASCKLDS